MSESKELALELSEESYKLIAAADAEVTAASERRNLILAATFATARIPVAAVNRIDKQPDGKIVLFYCVPSGNGKSEGG